MKRKLPIILTLLAVATLSCSKKEDQLRPLAQTVKPTKQKYVQIVIEDYCLNDNRERSNFFAVNMSMKVEKDTIYVDYDRDGIPNYRDINEELNIGLWKKDSNRDGYSDLIVYYAGFLKEQQENLNLCYDFEQDTDLDGLNDCEELAIGTDITNFDTDDDGIPDYLEIRSGLEPLDDPFDANLDPDMDGVKNFEEIKMNTPVFETNNAAINKFALIYDSNKNPDMPMDDCYTYTISNVPIVPTTNGNLINLYFIEKSMLDTSDKYMYTYSILVTPETGDEHVFKYTYSELQEFLVGAPN